jgi:hypothetical protein
MGQEDEAYPIRTTKGHIVMDNAENYIATTPSRTEEREIPRVIGYLIAEIDRLQQMADTLEKNLVPVSQNTPTPTVEEVRAAATELITAPHAERIMNMVSALRDVNDRLYRLNGRLEV